MFQGKVLSKENSSTWCRLLLATLVWYFFAVFLFPLLQERTGVCCVSSILSKQQCFKSRHHWSGLDISGHCFLLTWNNLVIVEEVRRLNTVMDNASNNFLLFTVRNLLSVLMIVWEIMMFATSLYFHTLGEKVLGKKDQIDIYPGNMSEYQFISIQESSAPFFPGC